MFYISRSNFFARLILPGTTSCHFFVDRLLTFFNTFAIRCVYLVSSANFQWWHASLLLSISKRKVFRFVCYGYILFFVHSLSAVVPERTFFVPVYDGRRFFGFYFIFFFFRRCWTWLNYLARFSVLFINNC